MVSSSNADFAIEDLISLHRHHLSRNPSFMSLAKSGPSAWVNPKSLYDFVPLPVDSFKHSYFPSVGEEDIVRKMSSSGTSGMKSLIPLDAETAKRQTKAVGNQLAKVLGPRRRTIAIADSRSLLEGTSRSSARAAAVIAILSFARDTIWLEDEETSERLFESSRDGRGDLLVFGFTFKVFEAFLAKKNEYGQAFQGATLLHGGGWKSLEAESIGRAAFSQALKNTYGFDRVIDYYGMVEQLGSMWFEKSLGLFHPPPNGAAIIRDVESLEPIQEEGSPGLIQLFSTVPLSYPGHSLLTGDIGYFERSPVNPGELALVVEGRLSRLASRGCSDAMQQANPDLVLQDSTAGAN